MDFSLVSLETWQTWKCFWLKVQKCLRNVYSRKCQAVTMRMVFPCGLTNTWNTCCTFHSVENSFAIWSCITLFTVCTFLCSFLFTEKLVFPHIVYVYIIWMIFIHSFIFHYCFIHDQDNMTKIDILWVDLNSQHSWRYHVFPWASCSPSCLHIRCSFWWVWHWVDELDQKVSSRENLKLWREVGLQYFDNFEKKSFLFIKGRAIAKKRLLCDLLSARRDIKNK